MRLVAFEIVVDSKQLLWRCINLDAHVLVVGGCCRQLKFVGERVVANLLGALRLRAIRQGSVRHLALHATSERRRLKRRR